MQAPKPGTVMGSHVYTGGDPGDEKSWTHLGAINSAFPDLTEKMGRLNTARSWVEGEVANKPIYPDLKTGAIGGATSWAFGPAANLKSLLAPVVAKQTLGTITEAKQSGASLGTNPTDFDAQIYRQAVANLDNQGVPAPQYLREIEAARGAMSRRAPGLTPDSPLILAQPRSRADLPKGAFYQDPEGNVRRNDNQDRGNPIVRKAAPPIAAPPRAAQSGGSVIRYDAEGNRIR
jgi:hypothetical protein